MNVSGKVAAMVSPYLFHVGHEGGNIEKAGRRQRDFIPENSEQDVYKEIGTTACDEEDSEGRN